MTGLIQKSGYIKPGTGGGHYAEYIATREGVELIEAPRPAHDGGGYLEYMAERPRSHGLFSANGPADLEKTMEEINGHTGPVWTFVWSLRREDAARLGYETSESWRKLLLAHQTELAQAMKISPGNFRWRAAFHDEKHHPHVHVMVWSADPKQRFLTEKGIEKMRSQLSNEIFRDELLSLYQQKNLSYGQVRDAAMEAMGSLIREMETGLCHSPAIETRMETLAGMLEGHRGKKVYGYLKKPAKAQVDAIVDELSKVPEVAECYEQWNQLRDKLERYYKDTPRERKPLSQQKEFRAIKNMVIREAEQLRLGTFTFEDSRMRDEVDEDQDEVYFAWNADWQRTQAYLNAREVLEEYENPESEKAEQVQILEQLWQSGFSLAAYQLGKCWRDGRGVLPDDERAELWFRRAADAGYDFAQYALGKLLQSQKRMDEAVSWYKKAAAQGNAWAAYRLGKLYLEGKDVPKDVPKAVAYLTDSAQQGSQYAQYALGKLYLTGQGVKQDREQVWAYFYESAEQGNEYAAFFLDHFDQVRKPSVFLAATKLLYLTGINCVADVAMQSFMATKHLYGKDTGTFFYQYTQSFSPEEDLTPAQAHEIGLELAERFFPGCEVLVATHVDREHLHSHLVVNSVHPDTGKKLHFTPRTLEQMRKVSDQICMEHGLSTLKPYRQEHRTSGLSAGEYRAAMRGESWKFRLITTVEAVMRIASNREEFIQEMKRRGYQVRWEEHRKHITYTTPTGMKCRDDKLHELKFRKENMEHEFGIRNQAAKQRLNRTQTAGSTACSDGPKAQCAVHHADTDCRAAGGGPAADLGITENDSGIHGSSGHKREPGAAGYGGTAPSVAGADTGSQSENPSGDGRDSLRNEGGTQTGWEAERRVYQGALRDPDNLSEGYPGSDCLAPQMDPLHYHEFSGGGSAGVHPDVADADITDEVLRLLSRLEGNNDDYVLDATTRHSRGDRKALAKEQRKKIALGHKEDDHEQGQQMM